MRDKLIYMVSIDEHGRGFGAVEFPNIPRVKAAIELMELEGWIRTDKDGYVKVKKAMRSQDRKSVEDGQ